MTGRLQAEERHFKSREEARRDFPAVYHFWDRLGQLEAIFQCAGHGRVHRRPRHVHHPPGESRRADRIGHADRGHGHEPGGEDRDGPGPRAHQAVPCPADRIGRHRPGLPPDPDAVQQGHVRPAALGGLRAALLLRRTGPAGAGGEGRGEHDPGPGALHAHGRGRHAVGERDPEPEPGRDPCRHDRPEHGHPRPPEPRRDRGEDRSGRGEDGQSRRSRPQRRRLGHDLEQPPDALRREGRLRPGPSPPLHGRREGRADPGRKDALPAPGRVLRRIPPHPGERGRFAVREPPGPRPRHPLRPPEQGRRGSGVLRQPGLRRQRGHVRGADVRGHARRASHQPDGVRQAEPGPSGEASQGGPGRRGRAAASPATRPARS